MYDEEVLKAQEHFGNILKEQIERVERMKEDTEWRDYSKIKPVIIGIVDGDGIGPVITKTTHNILESLLEKEIGDGTVELRNIEGLTLENRLKVCQAIPSDILEKIKECHVILKGPTTTPKKTDSYANIESANVVMRRQLDLFANVRPVKVPEEDIDWVFFRENTEGAYVLGSKGVNVTEDIAIDFKVITTQGAERIIRLAFDYAAKNNINKVSVVTKANVVKATDGKFLETAERIAKEYPQVEWDDWYIDIMAAKLIDPMRRTQFKVVVLPNLYGDVITDEAAQFQGGVGTAGSANIGKKYAMFEAIHGSAPRMVEEGRAKYANPTSILRATVMLLKHIGYIGKAERLEKALDVCTIYEKKNETTGRETGATTEELGGYIIETLDDKGLGDRWSGYQR